MKTKQQPIRPGDQLKDSVRRIWKVHRTLPGGRLELFCPQFTLFFDCYRPHVADWERMP